LHGDEGHLEAAREVVGGEQHASWYGRLWNTAAVTIDLTPA